MSRQMPPRMKEKLEKLGISHLEYLGDMDCVIEAGNKDVKQLKKKGYWEFGEKYSITAYVLYQTRSGHIVEVDEETIQDFAVIETEDHKAGYFVVGPYTIHRGDTIFTPGIDALLCVRELEKTLSGRWLGHDMEAFDLDIILKYESRHVCQCHPTTEQ